MKRSLILALICLVIGSSLVNSQHINAEDAASAKTYQCLRVDRQATPPGSSITITEKEAEELRKQAEQFKQAYEERMADRSRKYSAQDYLQDQQEGLARMWSTGCNRKLCINILKGVGAEGKLLPWAQIFNPGYWIPVVPSECIKCVEDWASGGAIKLSDGTYKVEREYGKVPEMIECPGGDQQSVPLPVNLMPHIAIRLYGLIASISIYALLLVAGVIGIRYLVGGLAKGGRYTDTARDLRNVLSALIITLIAGTLLLQILFTVLKVSETIGIPDACLPTTSKDIYEKDKESFCQPYNSL